MSQCRYSAKFKSVKSVLCDYNFIGDEHGNQIVFDNRSYSVPHFDWLRIDDHEICSLEEKSSFYASISRVKYNAIIHCANFNFEEIQHLITLPPNSPFNLKVKRMLPSPSVTPSVTMTPSITLSNTPSVTITPSISLSTTPSVTPSITLSNTPSVTPSVTITPSISLSTTPSVTPSITLSNTPSVTSSVTITPSITISNTSSATPSITPSQTLSSTPTPTITQTQTSTVTPSAGYVYEGWEPTQDDLNEGAEGNSNWKTEEDIVLNPEGTVEQWGGGEVGTFYAGNDDDRKPTLTTLNGLPAINFDGREDGNGDYLNTLTNESPLYTGNGVDDRILKNGLAFFIAGYQDAEPDGFGNYDRGSMFRHSNMWITAHAPWNDGRVFFDIDVNHCYGGAGSDQATCEANGGEWHTRERIHSTKWMQDRAGNQITGHYFIGEWLHDSVNTTQQIWKNGTLLIENTNSNPPLHVDPDANIRLAQAGYHQKVVMGEIIILDYYPDQKKREKIEGYLGHKWRFPQELDPNHPFLNFPPSKGDTTLLQSVTAGSNELTVHDQSIFNVGDFVQIDAGESNEEIIQVDSFGSLILSSNLQFDHYAGASIDKFIPPTPSATITPTQTITPTITPTVTPSATITPTQTITPTITPTVTPTLPVECDTLPGTLPFKLCDAPPSPSPTQTPTQTITPTFTPTLTPSISRTPDATTTPTPTQTITPTPSLPGPGEGFILTSVNYQNPATTYLADNLDNYDYSYLANDTENRITTYSASDSDNAFHIRVHLPPREGQSFDAFLDIYIGANGMRIENNDSLIQKGQSNMLNMGSAGYYIYYSGSPFELTTSSAHYLIISLNPIF